MLSDIRKVFYFSMAKRYFNNSVTKGLIVPFDDELYSKLEKTYVNSMPLSLYIRYMKPVLPPVNDHDRAIFMFVAMDDVKLVTADIEILNFYIVLEMLVIVGLKMKIMFMILFLY